MLNKQYTLNSELCLLTRVYGICHDQEVIIHFKTVILPVVVCKYRFDLTLSHPQYAFSWCVHNIYVS